jgi:transposase InsO family protein
MSTSVQIKITFIYKSNRVIYMVVPRIERLIKETYLNPKTGFQSAAALHKKLKDQGVKLAEVKEVLSKLENFQQHTNVKHGRSSFVASQPNQQFHIDLLEMPLTQSSKGYRFGFVAVDTFSKKVHVVAMKTKNESDIVNGTKKIFNKLGTPNSLFGDRESAFLSAEYETFLESVNVTFLFTKRHASMVERVIRTLKNMLVKSMNASGDSWISLIDDVVENYNSTEHTTTGFKPDSAHTGKTNLQVASNIATKAKFSKEQNIPVGTKVKVRINGNTFSKEARKKWSDKIYTVEERHSSSLYKLEGRQELMDFLELLPVPDETKEKEEPVAAAKEVSRDESSFAQVLGKSTVDEAPTSTKALVGRTIMLKWKGLLGKDFRGWAKGKVLEVSTKETIVEWSADHESSANLRLSQYLGATARADSARDGTWVLLAH